MKPHPLPILAVLVIVLISGCVRPETPAGPAENITEPTEPGVYEPQINPQDFVSGIDNRYFNLTPGTTYIYEVETDEGTERIEVYVSNETREVMGVTTMVIWDREWLEGDMIEDTKDWYAQDKEGNVWYFGEDSKEYVKGRLVSTEGSWEGGVDGAQPGIIMKANPQVGDTYRQEYYRGHAEDEGEVVAIGETVIISYGTFTNCLKVRGWTLLEPGISEHEFYCPEIGFTALEIEFDSGEIGERVELIGVERNIYKKILEAEAEELRTNITEEEAIEIATQFLEGPVTEVGIEFKLGRVAWVIEIRSPQEGETDVIIDIETGEILGTEK